MAIRARLGDYEQVTNDVLGRSAIDYFPRMTEAEALEADRGVWLLNPKVIARDCACGCGETITHDFGPGHELRAIQARVREHFGGPALAFITWLDIELPPKASAA
ncbi:hypothetical protein [Streptomyces sp. NPDC058751]|uniref:hypothetical protein n=1 Tax=Streptomyces sp. NPDC058751 TaxID=3346623 RepID=UPI00368E5B8D